MDTDLEKKLLRPADVAAICGVSRNTVYRWLRAQVFNRVRIGGNTYIKRTELRGYLNGDSDDGASSEPPVLLLSEAEGNAAQLPKSSTKLRSTR